MINEDKEKQVFDTPELILKDAVLRSKRLDEESQIALSKKDTVMCKRRLVERARLIADLPVRVKETMAKGQSFPEEGLRQLEDFSELAQKALEDGRTFGLSVILKPDRGSKESEPNLLEELVDKLYPPKS
jgi:hypothetical protein